MGAALGAAATGWTFLFAQLPAGAAHPAAAADVARLRWAPLEEAEGEAQTARRLRPHPLLRCGRRSHGTPAAAQLGNAVQRVRCVKLTCPPAL